MVFQLQYTLCSSDRDPEMPTTIASLPQDSVNTPSLAFDSSINRAIAIPSSRSTASNTFDRKPLMSCSTSSKMSQLLKSGLPQSPQPASVSFHQEPLVAHTNGSIIRHDNSLDNIQNTPASNSKPCQLRFWCPKPSKTAMFNKLAAHRHTPPPQVLRQRECVYNSRMQFAIHDDEEEDVDDGDDDEYYGSSSEEDEEDDYSEQYDNHSDDGLATRFASCSTFNDDDCIFSSD